MASVTVGAHEVGDGHPTFVIAELSANHNNSLSLAMETIAAAAEAGADAIKLQTYRPDTITFPGSSSVFTVTGAGQWSGRTLYDLYAEGMTPWEWHGELFQEAARLGLEAFSSPFDPTAVAFLADLGVPAYKIASFEITDVPLIDTVARQGKPVIMSTGIADLGDIELAVETCRAAGNDSIILLKCTSAYPAPLNQLNLGTIPDMRERFSTLVGFSDHTMTPTASVAAVALGAHVIERHIILDRDSGGLDSGFSANPGEFSEMVAMIREAEVARGHVTYDLTESAISGRRFARSLFVVADVRQGDLVDDRNVRSIRPADGLHPGRLAALRGHRFATDVAAGTPMTEDLID